MWVGNVGGAGQDGHDRHRVNDAEIGYVAHQGTVVEYLGSPWLVQGVGLEGNGVGGHEGVVGPDPLHMGTGFLEIATEMRASLNCNGPGDGKMSEGEGVA